MARGGKRKGAGLKPGSTIYRETQYPEQIAFRCTEKQKQAYMKLENKGAAFLRAMLDTLSPPSSENEKGGE